MLDWLTPENFASSTDTVVLRPSDSYGDSVKLFPSGSPEDPVEEFFMVQNRARAGNDTGLPADGLLIWHVDASLNAGRTDFLYDNSGTEHKLLRLMEADGQEEIEDGQAADAYDFFTQGKSFGPDTTPSSNRYDGTGSGVYVNNITGDIVSRSFDCGISPHYLAPSFMQVYASSLTVGWNSIPAFDYVAVLASDSGYSQIVSSAVQVTNSVTYTGLRPGKEYFFEVKSKIYPDVAYLSNRISTVTSPGAWAAAPSMSVGRYSHSAVLMPNGKVLVAGGYNGSYLSSAEVYDPVSNTFTGTASMSSARRGAVAVLLSDGRVLTAGGSDANGSYIASAEIYSPETGTWADAAPMSAVRYVQTMTLLPNGKVLVAGGYNGSFLSSAELYDARTNTWASAGNMSKARYGHTATLLSSGKVLIAGGQNSNGNQASAELYDPASNTWSGAGTMSAARYIHTATRLANGKVLVAGGSNTSALSGAEIFDPADNSWVTTGSMAEARYSHVAVQLPNGRVLVSGGTGQSSSEIYDPDVNMWVSAGGMPTARSLATGTLLPNGKVLAAGGNGPDLSSTGLFSAADSLITGLQPAFTQVNYSSITVVWTQIPGADYTVVLSSCAAFMHQVSSVTQSGNSAVFTGLQTGTQYFFKVKLSTETEWAYVGNRISMITLSPASLSWTNEPGYALGGLYPESGSSTTTFVYRVNYFNVNNTAPAEGYPKVHIRKGGRAIPGSPFTMSYATGDYATGATYLYALTLATGTDFSYYFEARDAENNPATGFPASILDSPDVYYGFWSQASAMLSSRYDHTATLLPNGKVLVVGGYGGGGMLASAEIYSPDTDSWASAADMSVARYKHAATLLKNGKVLVTGGYNGAYLASAEIYDPENDVWISVGSMSVTRSAHTATLLPNGNVLVAGGFSPASEEYDPEANTWSGVTTMPSVRQDHSATLLPNGKVMLAGGYTGTNCLNDILYDPSARAWQNTSALLWCQRNNNTSTLLSNGQVFVAGGWVSVQGNIIYNNSTEIYDSATAARMIGPFMSSARASHSSVLLPDGNVLIAGGGSYPSYLSASEIYVPGTNSIINIDPMASARGSHTSTLLPNGKVLTAGGYSGGSLNSAELFSPAAILTKLAPTFTEIWLSSVTVAWTHIPGADYAIRFSSDASFQTGISSLTQSGNSAVFPGLSARTRYFFEVKLSTEVEWAYMGNRVSTFTLTPAALSWTGEPDYVSDALSPEFGTSSMTFVYRIKYVNSNNTAPAAGYPRVYIRKGGADIAGSPFVMQYVSGNYSSGAVYQYQSGLNIGKDYSYSFEARDADNNLATAPLVPIDAPDVIFADMYESDGNSSSAKMITAGITQQHSIYPANELDWVKFTVPAASSVTIVISPRGWLYLYDSNLVQLAMDVTGTSPYTYKPSTLQAGTYYLKVYDPLEVPVYDLTLSAATLLRPGFSQVYVTSATVAWDVVAGEEYTAVLSSDTAFTSVISSTTGMENTKSYTGLFPGTTYYLKVKLSGESDASYAVNYASFTALPDISPPAGVAGTPYTDGPYSSVSTITFAWGAGTAADPESGIAGYYLQIGTDTASDDCSVFNGEVGNVHLKQVHGLAEGRAYFARVRGKNGVGAYGAYSPWSSGAGIDLSSPTAVAVLSDGVGADVMYSTSASVLAANWDASIDPQSGIARYWYAIGTTPGGSEIRAWTDNGIALSTAASGLSLAEGAVYYFAVRAENGAGSLSQAVVSNGQIVDTLPPVSLGFGSIGVLSANTVITTGTAVDSNSALASLPYFIQRSTDGVSWGNYDSGWVASACSWQELAPNATAWFRLKARDRAGNESAYSDIISAITFPVQPEASGGGVYTNIQNASLTVNWSSGNAVAGYDPEGILYETELSTTAGFDILAGASRTHILSAVFSGLSTNTTYYARVRAEGFGGPGPYTDLGWIATLARPPAYSGFLNVWRSSITVGWGANGNPSGTFYQTEFWTAGGSTTTLTVGSDEVAITGLRQETTVYTRIRAVNFSGIHSDYDLTISTFIPATIAPITADESDRLFYNQVSMIVPANTFVEDISVSMKMPESVPPDNEDLKSLPDRVIVDISALDAGMQRRQPLKDVELAVDYTGMTLGGADEGALVIATYNESRSVWVPLYTRRDRIAKIVTAKVGHFSLFQLMYSVAGAGISGVTVGPNPLKPSSNPGQSFTFRNLPADGRVRIYSYLGELLCEVRADGSGMAVWDGRNKSGVRVSSGLYLALVQGSGDKRIIKLVIER
jgi:N-acetylneuraminic acid mutarotase